MAKPAGASAPASASVPSVPDYDSDAERQLLLLANQARAQAGLAPLQEDDGLTQAARAHAAAMAAQQQLSHQLPGEPSLPQRLSGIGNVHFDRAGENVGYAPDVERAEASFMRSPHHRENLLDPGFNVAGFAVVHSGDLIYVVQDFGHNLPVHSPQTSEAIVAAAVERTREQSGLPPLQLAESSAAHDSACEMAQRDSIKVLVPTKFALSQYALRYTVLTPETLPSAITKATGDRKVRAFSVGACYARTSTYPNGAYFVALYFY